MPTAVASARRIFARVNRWTTYYYIAIMATNLAVGYHILLHRPGIFGGTRLEQSIHTDGAMEGIGVVATMAVIVFVRSLLDAADSYEVNKIITGVSIELVDSMIFDGILAFGLNAPIFGLKFGGQMRVPLFILFDASRVFLLVGGLFIFVSLRKEPNAKFYPIVYIVLLFGQILFFYSLVHEPSLSSVSNILHFVGMASIPFLEYCWERKRALESYTSGRIFIFNTSENLKLAFHIYHALAYALHWGAVLLSPSPRRLTYLDWTRETVALTLIPAVMTAAGVLVQPKRLDSRTKQLYEALLVRRSNQSAELASLSRKYLAEKSRHQELLEQMLPPRVVQELQLTGAVASEHFDHCSIFFSDIESYTSICAATSKEEVVLMLNHLYTLFDSILELDPRCWKVETVGDGERAVANLPLVAPPFSVICCSC